jgi:hypothetical protein
MNEITHLTRHLVRGEERWTGRIVVPGQLPLDVLVTNVEGRLVAFQLRCPHMVRDLTKGTIMNGQAIECPSHGWVIPLVRLKGREVTRDAEGRMFAGAPFVAPAEDEEAGIGYPRDGV